MLCGVGPLYIRICSADGNVCVGAIQQLLSVGPSLRAKRVSGSSWDGILKYDLVSLRLAIEESNTNVNE